MGETEKPIITLSGVARAGPATGSGVGLIVSFEEFDQVLGEDTAYCKYMAKKPDLGQTEGNTQFWRRAFVRAALAQVEGMTYYLKQRAIDLHSKASNSIFSQTEVILLEEDRQKKYPIHGPNPTFMT